MRVRINIPAWRWREVAAGLAAVARGPRAHSARDEFALAIGTVVPGWTPVPVASARFAIALAVRALGLAGKRIGVPAYLCPAVLAGLGAAPAEVVPLECATASVSFDESAVAEAVAGDRIDAILAPNTYGVNQDFGMLGRLGVPVIEDAAYQIGLTDAKGTPFGTRGDAGVWSLNFKALTAVGGGVLLLGSQRAPMVDAPSFDIAETTRFANYAIRAALRHNIPSFLPGATAPSRHRSTETRRALGELRESQMSEVQAAIAVMQWKERERLNAIQRRNVAMLVDAIDRSTRFCTVAGPDDMLVHLFPLLATTRDAAFDARRMLFERGIQTEDPYPLLWDRPERFPNSLDTADRLVLVPCNASLGDRQIRRIAEALRILS